MSQFFKRFINPFFCFVRVCFDWAERKNIQFLIQKNTKLWHILKQVSCPHKRMCCLVLKVVKHRSEQKKSFKYTYLIYQIFYLTLSLRKTPNFCQTDWLTLVTALTLLSYRWQHPHSGQAFHTGRVGWTAAHLLHAT